MRPYLIALCLALLATASRAAPPTVELPAVVASGHGVSSINVTMSTSSSAKLLVFNIAAENVSGSAPTVTSITSSGPTLIYTERSGMPYKPASWTAGSCTGSVTVFPMLDEWTAPLTTALSSVVFTVNFSGTVDGVMVGAYGVDGVSNPSSPFDPNVALPYTQSHQASAALTMSWTTTNPNDLLITWAAGSSNGGFPGSTFTGGIPALLPLTTEGLGTNWQSIAGFYNTVTAVQSGTTGSYGPTGACQIGVADALTNTAVASRIPQVWINE